MLCFAHNIRTTDDDDAFFWLAGVDDWSASSGAWPGFGPDVDAALGGVGDSAESVLLAHQPAEWASARRLGAGLMLSGHNHRGQVWPQHYLVMLAQPLFYGHYGPRDGQPRGGEARTQVSRSCLLYMCI